MASSLTIDYVIEPQPGIAAARNAALDRLPSDATHLVFVDDDEIVSPQWIRALCAAEEAYGAEIVCARSARSSPSMRPRGSNAGGTCSAIPSARG